MVNMMRYYAEMTNEDRPQYLVTYLSVCGTINKSTSYAGATGASAKELPKVNSNFRPLVADPVFDGVNISIPRKFVEKDGISLIATFIGKPVMLDSYTSSMCNDSWGRSSFARCLIEVNSEADLVDVVTIGIPSLSEDDFTKETIRVEKTNDGFQTVGKKKKRKGKSKSTNGGQFTGLLVKHNVRYEPKATTRAPKKGITYVGYTSQSTPIKEEEVKKMKTPSPSGDSRNQCVDKTVSVFVAFESGGAAEVGNGSGGSDPG
ncbi:hypothetical protein Tco_0093621 [Tanacetum coccineum]